MKYSTVNGIRMVEVPVSDLEIILYDGKKKSMGRDRCNAGFFGNYNEGADKFTLPVGHLVCDFAASSQHTMKYCKERGRLDGSRFTFDAAKWSYDNPFYGKSVSSLLIAGGKARVEDLVTLPAGLDYAISGVPILRSGKDVKFATYVRDQGWDGSTLYATWHIFIGIKAPSAETIYIMAMKTTSGNMITSAEAFKKFSAMGFYDVLKLDGGGSCYLNAGGAVTSTLENRRVCTILDFSPKHRAGNPYPVPTRALRRGKTGDDVRWLQMELTDHGYPCDIDGSFGPGTDKQLRAYQAAAGLAVDGSCGPATVASLRGNN